MFILTCELHIGNYTFRHLLSAQVVKSVDNLSDTCIIEMPARFKVLAGGQELSTREALKAGDPVRLVLGYEDKYTGVEFNGFLKKIKPGTPLKLECEDAVYFLRQNNIRWAKDHTTLQEVLQQVVKDTPVKLSEHIPHLPLDKWEIRDANGAQVLESIRRELCMTVLINDRGDLYCGLSQATNVGQTATYDLNYNIIQNDLEYVSREDIRLRVKYIYKDDKNAKRSVVVGDPDGELRTFHTSVVSDIEKLKEMALAELAKLKYDGYTGSITSFLIPYATRGMGAKIIDRESPERGGLFFIEKVVTTFSTSGARRTVTLGKKI